MLKIWKQAWKKEDGSAQDASQGSSNSPRGNATGDVDTESSASPTVKHHGSGAIQLISSPTTNAPSGPSRKNRSLDSTDNGRASKRIKLEVESGDWLPAEDDYISKHLPEIMDVDKPVKQERVGSQDVLSLVDSVVQDAKQRNTLAVLDSDLQKLDAITRLLEWTCAAGRDRPHTGVARRRRISVVVTDDTATATSRTSQLGGSGISLGIYTPSLHCTSVNSWAELVAKDLIVIAADLLLDCLNQGTFAISQIHTLIVDDLRPVMESERHPIRQIMRDFYSITDIISRPKMFGILLVSSVANLSFDLSLLKLEDLLDARFFGVPGSAREAVEHSPNKPTEIVVFYEPQVNVYETTLHRRVRNLDSRLAVPGMRRYVLNAQMALAEVGACACDFVWRRAFHELSKSEEGIPVYEEDDELQEGSPAAIAKARSNIKNVIRDWTFLMPNLDPHSRGCNVTPKMSKLVQILLACKPQVDTFRGIIFVQRRVIAYSLSDVLRGLDDKIGFLRPQVLTGDRIAAHNEILDGFRSGVYNLLICTKQAEELDLTPPTLVVRFDLFESQVSYAHCRARAKGPECHLVHMAERGSDVHLRVLSQLARTDAVTEKWIQKVASTQNGVVPPFPLNDTIDPYRSDSEDESSDRTLFIRDPTTSGKIYISDAITTLYRYVSRVRPLEPSADRLDHDEPLFEFEELQDPGSGGLTYICTVLLPPGSPLTRVSGEPSASMAQARRLACYQACKELFERGLLNYRLFPRPSLPSSRALRATYISSQLGEELSDKEDEEALLPSKAKLGQSQATGTRCYPQKKPDFWENSLPILRGCLYPTIITPSITADGQSEYQENEVYSPMLFLTRLPFPSVSDFNLFFSGVPGRVHVRRGATFEVDEDRLKDLYRYTIRIIRYITNKPFICALEKMAYFVAPLSLSSWDPRWGANSVSQETESRNDSLQSGYQSWDFPNVVDHVPWDLVALAANQHAVTLNTQDLQTLTEDIKDAMVQDRWVEFTRRYICVKMRPDLSPLSKPEDSLREKNYESLLDYCKARRKGFERLQNDTQPLIEVTQVPLVINHLNPNSAPTAPAKRHFAKYLIPELCVKCTISASVFRTATLLPSIINRLDDLLLVKELNAKFFDHTIHEHHLHAAVSAPSAGVEFDYERLELLGDAYLKYLSSIYLFVTFPVQSEGALHILRQRIISNRSLLRNSNRCGLPQYIQPKTFTPKAWAPPHFQVYQPPTQPRDEAPEDEGVAEKVDEGGVLPEAQAEEGRKSMRTTPSGPSTPVNDPSDSLAKGTEQTPSLSADAAQATESGTENRRRKQITGKRKRQADDNDTQWLGDKCVADVAEAIIGAAYATRGREIALKVTKALNIPVPHIDRWSDFGRKALAPSPAVTAKLQDGTIEAVEAIIGHKFNYPHLLAQALTHASAQASEMTSYERLEFIGDAIVDFLVIRHIFDRDGMLSPGALTLLKGAMVSNATLAAICVWAGLHEHLLFESYVLASDIQAYADDLRERQNAEYTRARDEGRSPGQYWADFEPPKALSDVVESIFGAVYVSDNFSPVGAEAFFERVLKPFYDQHITLRTLSHHPTKILFELFQSQGCQDFEITKAVMPADAEGHTAECIVLVHDVILSSATDTSTVSAARRASFLALDAIEGDPTFLSRTCNCRVLNQARKNAKKSMKSLFDAEDAEEQVVETVLKGDDEKNSDVITVERSS